MEIDVFQRLLRLYGVFRVITGRFLQQRKRADVDLILNIGIRLAKSSACFCASDRAVMTVSHESRSSSPQPTASKIRLIRFTKTPSYRINKVSSIPIYKNGTRGIASFGVIFFPRISSKPATAASTEPYSMAGSTSVQAQIQPGNRHQLYIATPSPLRLMR